jgi:hypothetical protein
MRAALPPALKASGIDCCGVAYHYNFESALDEIAQEVS